MSVIIDGTTGITTPGETNTGNLSVSGTTTLTTVLGAASGGTGLSSAGANGNVLTSNGTAWTSSVPVTGAFIPLVTTTASSSASVVFNSTYITSTYDVYMVELINVLPVTNNVTFRMDMSSNNGSSYISNMAFATVGSSPAASTALFSGSSGNFILLDGAFSISATSQTLSNTANNTYNGLVYIYKPSATSKVSTTWQGNFLSAQSNYIFVSGSSILVTAATVNAVSFAMSSGNIASGTFRLYGIKNS